MHLFRNPAKSREAEPGVQVRSGVTSVDETIDFDVVVHDPNARITKVSITYEVPSSKPARGRGKNRRPAPPDEVVFTFENGLKEPGGSR